MAVLTVTEIISKALPEKEWVNLAQVVGLLRNVDPDFSPTSYGFDKLRHMLKSVPDIVTIGRDDSVYPPSYKCMLIGKKAKNEFRKVTKIDKRDNNYKALFKRFRDQPFTEIFAHFPWNEDIGENWESPFEKLAKMAKSEIWDFQSAEFKIDGQKYTILRNYLNYTFLRLQQQNKIVMSQDSNRACINTGLQTPAEKDIFATFFLNKKHNQYNQPQWTFYAFADSYSEKIKDFPELPEIATYIEDSSELVFDLSYDLEINVDHIVQENKGRLPEIFSGNERLAMTAIQGATEFLKEKIRRNYKVAIPHWYHDKIQLLLPLNIQSDEKADLALVADKDKARKIYRIKTALTMDMAYIDARLICRPDREWLNP
ncbi:MAG: DUF3825 domain-containing protein [Hahellaceae bacterium]|nr:DUF3825 domain-containing protein [Hahellaceae bacterium]